MVPAEPKSRPSYDGVGPRASGVPCGRVLLVDASEHSRTSLERRLDSLGYAVEVAGTGLEAAAAALRSPPRAVIADLWLPGVSGIQLCRLLRAEPATASVPVILRGDADDRRNRFWAERAGATCFLGKGRIGELVRVLGRAIADAPPGEDSFFQVDGTARIHDRIASHLDAALFESVIAAEVRALAGAASAGILFDLLSQFLSQIHTYRWLAVWSQASGFFGLHHHEGRSERALEEAREALALPEVVPVALEDEDASSEERGPPPVVRPIRFGATELGTIAMAPSSAKPRESAALVDLVARELGGALQMTALVEETRRLASTDGLTKLMNRRAFTDWTEREMARLERYGGELGFGLLDIDHFKSINDRFGHGAGDGVLRDVARTLVRVLRSADVVARWGGEEFVFALPSSTLEGTRLAAERVRVALAEAPLRTPEGEPLRVTASVGFTAWRSGEGLAALADRADRGLYAAKHGGRDRISSVDDATSRPPGRVAHEAGTPPAKRAYGTSSEGSTDRSRPEEG